MNIKVSILFICFLVVFSCTETPKKDSKSTPPEVVKKKLRS